MRAGAQDDWVWPAFLRTRPGEQADSPWRAPGRRGSFGSTAIAYRIERGRRQKTVAIGVDPVGGVRVRAPADTPVAKLDNIVQRKARWILDRQRRQEDLPPPPTDREFVSGESFLYLGRQCRLKVARASHGDTCVRLRAGRLVVSTGGDANPEDIRHRLVAWYRERAVQRLPERVAEWAPKLDSHPGAVLIRDQRKRWGSVDSQGNIRFNWRVVQAPLTLVDYVVVHELVHLAYPDHTRDFWATLGSVMPDYEERRETLRRLGRGMVW
jgi:hypothetical protein